MIHFQWWWTVLLLPVPVLAYFLLPPLTAQFAGLKAPFYDLLAEKHAHGRRSSWIQRLLALTTWLLLLSAVMRPQWVGEPVALPLSGRDLMLAVDLSDSMKTRDMVFAGNRVNRLQAVQEIAGDFIERREGDRIGLILFGSEAYLQAPLTLDRDAVKTLLEEALIGIAGQRTAIGNAIALAAKRLQQREGEDKVLSLLTDGENTAGNISPDQALQAARQTGLKIHTIGIGAPDQGAMGSFFAPRSGVDERALQHIASSTGGRYFLARDAQELARIYTLIDELETVDEEVQTLRPVRELFYWPASLALFVGSLLLWTRERWNR